MHAKVFSATTVGTDAHIIEVEADLSVGMIGFHIVGLPGKAINESVDRIKAALKNCGYKLPERSITINLAPASLKKENFLFDVPITIAILQASRVLQMSGEFVDETIFLGELSLDGAIRSVRGVLSIAHGALKAGKRRLIVPSSNTQEASLIKGIEIIGVNNLLDLVMYLRKEKEIAPIPNRFDNFIPALKIHDLDFEQVKGQWQAKRALEIAAAGNHNILFVGSPGSGKTMLAQRLVTILPPMTFDEVIETTKIYSIAGQLKEESLVLHRPFRAPHHTISSAGLVGGGSSPTPGEISLAHNGVLFLDELTEFRRSTLEVLRQPLENKRVLISRALQSIEYLSSFILVAALNPCPCGFYGDKRKKCTCTEQKILAYLGKLSGPLLDRIDIHVNVTSVEFSELGGMEKNKKSSDMFKEVETARAIQIARNDTRFNASLSSTEVEKFCVLSSKAKDVMKKAFDKLGLSMRGYHKILKVARTIADVENSSEIQSHHLQEAISYRSLDQKLQKSIDLTISYSPQQNQY